MGSTGLALWLNNSTKLRVQIVSESFLVESTRVLFFHLSTSNFFHECDGIFSLDTIVSTVDHTPKSIQHLLKPALLAASHLFQIKAFVTRLSRSSLQSVLQEAVHKYIITPFYQRLEALKAPTIVAFIVEARGIFVDLKNALDIVNSSDPAEKVFHLARRGARPMMQIAVECLQLFAEFCKNVITVPDGTALRAPGFFIKYEDGLVTVSNLPSPVPPQFARDVADAALALIVRAPPMKLEAPFQNAGGAVGSLPVGQQDFLTFELLLPTDIPEYSTPDEAISNFRAAAWSLPLPAPPREIATVETFASLDEAVDRVLLAPIWAKAKGVQRSLVEFLLKDQQLPKVVQLMTSLFLMKRGDLHRAVITGSLQLQRAARTFQTFIGSVPFFEYRFLEIGRIAVVIPHRLRRIITSEQIVVWQNCYQWLSTVSRMQYLLQTMNQNRRVIGLRLKLMHFFVALHQIAMWQIENGLFEFHDKCKAAEKLDDLIEAHMALVARLEQVSMKPFGNITAHIDGMFAFAKDFCGRAALMTKQEVGQSEEQFGSFKAFLEGFLAVPARKEPAGLAASLLHALH
jgi:hypothetical protein